MAALSPRYAHWSLVAWLNAVNCANSGPLCAVAVCPVRNMNATATATTEVITAINGIVYLNIQFTYSLLM